MSTDVQTITKSQGYKQTNVQRSESASQDLHATVSIRWNTSTLAINRPTCSAVNRQVESCTQQLRYAGTRLYFSLMICLRNREEHYRQRREVTFLHRRLEVQHCKATDLHCNVHPCARLQADNQQVEDLMPACSKKHCVRKPKSSGAKEGLENFTGAQDFGF